MRAQAVSCPNCGADLDLTKRISFCPYCGRSIYLDDEVKREEKTININKNMVIKGQISYYLEVEGYTKQELASQLGMCVATLYNKLRNPNKFTLEEVRNLKLVLNLSDTQLLAII